MSTVLGEAFIRIRPLASTFEAETKASINRALGNVGKGGGAVADLEKTFSRAGGAARSTAGEIEKAGKSAQGLAGKLGITSKAGQSAFGALAGEVKSKMAGLSSAGGELSGVLGKVGGSLQGLGPAGAAVGTGLALDAAAIGAIVKSVGAFQRVAGGAAETDSLLVASLETLGVSPQIAARGFFQLSKTIEQHESKLTDLGITVARTKDGQVDLQGTLFNVSDAFNATDDQAKRNTIAFTAFGRAGLQLVPILAKGREGLKELSDEAAKSGLGLSAKDLEITRQLTIAKRQLGEAFKGVEIQLARGFVPAATDAVHSLTRLLQLGREAKDFVLAPTDFATNELSKLPVVGGLFYSTKKAAKDYGSSLDDVTGSSEDAAAASDDLAKSLTSVSDASIAQVSATQGVQSAQNAVTDANRAAADSNKDLARLHDQTTEAQNAASKAQKNYNDLVKIAGADVDAYATATRRLRDLQVSLTEAENSVGDSKDSIRVKQDALNEAIDTYGRNSDEARKATTELRDAQVGLDSANNRVLGAKDDLVSTHKDQANAAAGSAESNQRLADAHDRLTKAQDAVTQANDAETIFRENIPRLVQAQQDAYDRLAQANADLRVQQLLASGATADQIDKGQILREEYGKLEGTLDPKSALYKHLESYKNLVQDAATAQDTLNNALTNTVNAGDVVGRIFANPNTSLGEILGIPGFEPGGATTRPAAAGASFAAGEWGVVGEKGPELVRFRRDGQVFSHADSLAALASPAPVSVSGGSVYHIYPAQGQDEAQIARHIDAVQGGAVPAASGWRYTRAS